MNPTIALTDRETLQIEQANASGRTPVVFIHGLWVLPSSWDRWAELFEDAGYAAVTPSWTDDPETVAEARANPEILARKTLGQVADHTAQVIGGLDKKPAVMGHSTGRLLAQIIADRGQHARGGDGAAGVAERRHHRPLRRFGQLPRRLLPGRPRAAGGKDGRHAAPGDAGGAHRSFR